MKYTLLCLGLALTVYLQSCFPCDEPVMVTDGYLKLDLVDSSSSKSLLAVDSPLINKDSVVVTSLRGDTLQHFFALLNGAGSNREGLFIYFLEFYDPEHQASFKELQCKDIIVRLSSTKVFQVKACFKSRTSKCGDSFATTFELLELFYSGQKIGSASKTNEVAGVVKVR